MTFPSPPLDVARAKIGAGSRTKEFRFFAALEKLIAKHESGGLEKRPIARTIRLTAKGLEKMR
jgi:hypothetical protein